MGISTIQERLRALSRSFALARAYENGQLSLEQVRAAMTEPIHAESAASAEPAATAGESSTTAEPADDEQVAA